MADFDKFLPIGPPPRPAQSHKVYRDREADPKSKDARALGQYGFNLLEIIDKQYQKQITVWKDAFADVVAAYATAVDMRNKTFGEAKEERERDAARDAFIFSLLTGGAMVFLGAWVQYSLVPAATIRSYKWDFSPAAFSGNNEILKQVTVERFSKMQASMFGGLTKEIGGKLIPHTYPTPKPASYPTDVPSVAANLKADLDKNIDESSDVARDDLLEAQEWMNEGTEFGVAWLAYTGGNLERARMEIRLRFDKLRERWADGSEFFGKTPKPVVRKLLAEQYERGVWAGYFVSLYDPLFEPIPGSSTEEKLEKADGSWFMDGLPDWTPLVERVIVNRLKELNVIFPEPYGRYVLGEMIGMYRWAKGFLKSASGAATQKFFPPATPRKLDPLPTYN